MGDADFSRYCPQKNNCQHFLLAVLESNGLAHDLLTSFVMQNADDIFNRTPKHTDNVARALVNIAAVGDKVTEDVMELGEKYITNITKVISHKTQSVGVVAKKGGTGRCGKPK